MADAKPPPDEVGELLMPSQVVRRFQVDPKTIARWILAGKLDPLSTPGGHRRFRASDIRRCLQEEAHDGDPK